MVAFIGGVGLTAFAAWTWWRITDTFHTFLRDYERFSQQAPAPTAPPASDHPMPLDW